MWSIVSLHSWAIFLSKMTTVETTPCLFLLHLHFNHLGEAETLKNCWLQSTDFQRLKSKCFTLVATESCLKEQDPIWHSEMQFLELSKNRIDENRSPREGWDMMLMMMMMMMMLVVVVVVVMISWTEQPKYVHAKAQQIKCLNTFEAIWIWGFVSPPQQCTQKSGNTTICVISDYTSRSK